MKIVILTVAKFKTDSICSFVQCLNILINFSESKNRRSSLFQRLDMPVRQRKKGLDLHFVQKSKAPLHVWRKIFYHFFKFIPGCGENVVFTSGSFKGSLRLIVFNATRIARRGRADVGTRSLFDVP